MLKLLQWGLTGSEITPNASFIDTIEKRKMGINGEAIRPKYAILDPELTLSCPKAPTISAGVDSMVHSTEAFVAKKSNPMAKMFAKVGFKLVFENLPLLVDDMENIILREQVMYYLRYGPRGYPLKKPKPKDIIEMEAY